MFGDLDEEDIDAILHKQIIGHIACHANELTYVVPISYAYQNGKIFAHTYEGMKINIMRQNPKVCFAVHKMENMANWQSVIAWGNFEEITDPVNREAALKVLLMRDLPAITSKTVQLTPDWPFIPNNDLNKIVGGIVICIHLTMKTGRYESSDSVYL